MVFEERIVGDEPGVLLIQPTARHEAPTLDEEVRTMASLAGQSFVLVLLHVDAWDINLMPWPDDKISKDSRAGFCAADTLRFITDEILPEYEGLQVIIGGYSLAGLFALWASTVSDRFDSVAAASPSLWIKDWMPYAREHAVKANQVYLSLGDREEISKNSAIAKVGDCVREQYGLLTGQLGPEHSTLVWEQGGHFTDNAGRLARAFSWCLSRF